MVLISSLQLPDAGVVAGDNITIVTSLNDYYSTTISSLTTRVNYGQGQVRY